VVGFGRSAGWLAMQVGLPWTWERGAVLAATIAARLSAIPGVTVLTPSDRMATIVTFTIAGWTPGAALEELGARIFAIAAPVPHLDAIRISPGAWTAEDELERFAEGVTLLADHTPENLPPRRSLAVLP
jgi:selenocysteine lyase/cysteine desulfurase